jgi:transposase
LVVIHPVQEDENMTKTLSMDIRDRFRRYIGEGLTARAAGRALKISPASAVRYRQTILQDKSLYAKPRGGHRDGGKLAGYTGFLIELVNQDPDITLCELRDALEAAHGVRVHHSSVDRALRRAGYTFKKRASLQMSAARPTSGTPEPTG